MKTNLNAIFFSVAIIVASIFLGNAFKNKYNSKGEITATGLGEKEFTSDLIVWEGRFTKENPDIKQAYTELEKDKIIIENYLKENNINLKEVVFNAVDTRTLTKKNFTNEGKFIDDKVVGYSLSQSIQISSKEVEKVENLSRKITELLNKGIQFYSESPRYYYTKLADLKIELVSKATEDAKTRVDKITQMSGAKIEKLKDAQLGVFQITGLNSREEYSSGGTFNTSSKGKKASITVKLIYNTK